MTAAEQSIHDDRIANNAAYALDTLSDYIPRLYVAELVDAIRLAFCLATLAESIGGGEYDSALLGNDNRGWYVQAVCQGEAAAKELLSRIDKSAYQPQHIYVDLTAGSPAELARDVLNSL